MVITAIRFRAAHRSGTHDVLSIAPSKEVDEPFRVAIAAAYRRPLSCVLQYRQRWLLDAPTLLARADEVIE
jgi:hypothetical protein